MKGGERGMWLSKTSASDARLVVAESAIDALSFCALNDDGKSRYASLGGTPSSAQAALLQKEIYRMRPGSEICAASDADQGGEKVAEFVRAACELALQDGVFVRRSPTPYKDFNDALVRMRKPIPA
jgi:Toprim domain-containing protein